ncbi:MAG: hypothetical protein IKD89_04350 [Clostridia bacterium]|nr:hypothetical protein [Clostridia bacterium]
MKRIYKLAALALALAVTLALLSGCEKENTAYLTIDGEAADDAVYMYYLKSSMYRVMAMYGAQSSTEAFWTAELSGDETPFDTALALAAEKTAEEYIISREFDRLSIPWDDEKEAKFEESLGAMTAGGRSYEKFLAASGLTDEAWRFITKNAVKRAALCDYYDALGKSFESELSRLKASADVSANGEAISRLDPVKIIK